MMMWMSRVRQSPRGRCLPRGHSISQLSVGMQEPKVAPMVTRQPGIAATFRKTIFILDELSTWLSAASSISSSVDYPRSTMRPRDD